MDDVVKTDSLMTSIRKTMEYLSSQKKVLALAVDFLPTESLTQLNQFNNFAGMIVAPTDDAKNALLEIPYQVLNASGTKSEEVSLWMAQAVKKQLKTNIGIGIIKNNDDQTYWITIDNDEQEEPQVFPFPIKDKCLVIEKVFHLIVK